MIGSCHPTRRRRWLILGAISYSINAKSTGQPLEK